MLTLAYRDIYASSEEDDVGQLSLLTSPTAANEEVMQLFQSGLIPVEIAMQSVLNSIGTPKEVIDSAVQEAIAKKAEDSANTKENKALDKEHRRLDLEARQSEASRAAPSASDENKTANL